MCVFSRKIFNFLYIFIIPTLISLPGCSKKSHKNENFVTGRIASVLSESEAIKLASAGDNEDAAEKYARIGELLLFPGAIEYADEMFDKSLNLNPNNRKANFYSAFTKPLMTTKGFLPRFAKLAETEGVDNKLERLRKEIDELDLPEVRVFANQLPNGKLPFENNYDVQRFLRTEVLPALLDSSFKLGKLVNGEDIELNINFKRIWNEKLGLNSAYLARSYCHRNIKNEWGCNVPQELSSHSARTIKVDPVDIKVLRGSMMAFVDSIRLSTAYKTLGLDEALRKIELIYQRKKMLGERLTTRDVVRVLRGYNDLLLLEDDHQIPELVSSTEEVLRHAMDLHTAKYEICKNPIRRNSSRLFPSICVGLSAATNIELALDLLAGPQEIELGKNKKGKPVKIYIDVAPLVQNSPRDLKEFLPTNFDANGDPASLPDPTMGGLFPDGDFLEKIKEVKRFRKLKLNTFSK